MLTFLRDLLAHAEWANAVFFHTWSKTPAQLVYEASGGNIVSFNPGLYGTSPGGPSAPKNLRVTP